MAGKTIAAQQSVPMRRRTFLAATLAAAAAASGACGFGSDGDGNTSNNDNPSGGTGEPQQGGTLRQSMLPITHLDPAVSGNASFGQILMIGLWEGLVVPDADDPAQVLPGVAESWEASDDGLTYTFHLRADAKWSNGDPVTAQDFEWNWKRGLTPGIAGEGNPSYRHDRVGIRGADAYMNGETEDFSAVGAKALDDATFEITLEHPNPDILMHLAQYSALPLHPATVEKHGNGWFDPANWVSNGAYVLDDFRVNQGATLVPNDEYWDTTHYYLDRWEITFNDGGTTADLLAYQNDEIDITGRIEDDLEAVTASDVADELVSSPTNQYRHLTVLNSRHPALHDIRVRKALSLALDREALGGVAKPAVPGNSLVPSGVGGSDQIPGVEFNISAAQDLLAEAGYPDGDGMPTITLLDFQSSPWVEAIAEMWRTNLGVNVELDIVELGVYLEKGYDTLLHAEEYVGFVVINNSVQPPTLLGAAHTIRYSRLLTYGLNLAPVDVIEELLAAKDDGADDAELMAMLEGKRHPECEKAVTLAGDAIAETDPTRQESLAIDAAIARDEAYASIPVLWGGYFLLVKPRVKDLKPWHHTSVHTTKNVWVDG